MHVAQFTVEITFYSILFVFLLIQIIRLIFYRDLQLFYNLQLRFHVLSIIFAIARIIATGLETSFEKYKLSVFIVKRIAYLSFFTSFTLLLFFWSKIAKGLQHNDKTPNSIKIPLIVANFVFYLFTIISIIIFSTSVADPDYSNSFYQVNSVIVAAAFFVVSISFMVYGIVLLRKFKKLPDLVLSRKKYMTKAFFLTLFVSICFLLKVAMFLYHPISEKDMNSWLFLFLGYFIPELIPAYIQAYGMRPKTQKNAKTTEMRLLDETTKN
ncbi:tobamovirus multiplication protein 1-like isoform x1 [Anaeramoeba ignava]|uniref:Tobamovirus multiplication protein 1-like isoform x1 n=1 Tax=Anaeramoeba ignava TaxID=1746090 RepID=A0A9Q0L632_ANAIG|nr:tobamovirus multiplication protein 1-like isoform x1 [Anaeramoeba ignava]